MSQTSCVILLILTIVLISNAQAYPINVTDDFGYEATIEKQPERIVSLSPCNTEILFVVGAGDKVIGGTTYDAYPPEAVNLPKIGGFSSVNIEAVVNLTPDLVLAEDTNGEDTINSLRNLDFTVITFNPQSMDDILDNIRLVGDITGNEDTAESVTEDMILQILSITSQTENMSYDQRPRVLYLVWHDPLYAAGSDTYPSDLIWMSGGKNILEGEGWPIISLEEVINKNPQVIICSGMGGGSYIIMEAIKNNDILAQTDAVKNQKVYAIADSQTIELAGPRIVQGLAELHGYIAPEIVKESESPNNPFDITYREDSFEGSPDASKAPGFSLILAMTILITVYLRRMLY
ncbi:MAG: cobalamin-binding protein [Methanosarcinaceae archaeon]|nr:cobalamin-binding protein [Methanosarcinaceae archaeon]